MFVLINFFEKHFPRMKIFLTKTTILKKVSLSKLKQKSNVYYHFHIPKYSFFYFEFHREDPDVNFDLSNKSTHQSDSSEI